MKKPLDKQKSMILLIFTQKNIDFTSIGVLTNDIGSYIMYL